MKVTTLLLLFGAASAVELRNMLGKSSSKMHCHGLKEFELAHCQDYNLLIEKSEAALKHCIMSKHHSHEKKLDCVDRVVEERDNDLLKLKVEYLDKHIKTAKHREEKHKEKKHEKKDEKHSDKKKTEKHADKKHEKKAEKKHEKKA